MIAPKSLHQYTIIVIVQYSYVINMHTIQERAEMCKQFLYVTHNDVPVFFVFAHTQFSYTENSINVLFTAIHSILFDSFYRQELNTSEQFRHTYRDISLFCTRTSEWFFGC